MEEPEPPNALSADLQGLVRPISHRRKRGPSSHPLEPIGTGRALGANRSRSQVSLRVIPLRTDRHRRSFFVVLTD